MEGKRGLHLEINVMSAKNLKKVNKITTMDVVAEVSINGDDRAMLKTPVVKASGPNPVWKCHMEFAMDRDAVDKTPCNLLFKLKSDRKLGDRYIGKVVVSIRKLLDQGNENTERKVTYGVLLGKGVKHGTLTFSYKFKYLDEDEIKNAAVAYPPQASSSGFSSPVQERRKRGCGLIKILFGLALTQMDSDDSEASAEDEPA